MAVPGVRPVVGAHAERAVVRRRGIDRRLRYGVAGARADVRDVALPERVLGLRDRAPWRTVAAVARIIAARGRNEEDASGAHREGQRVGSALRGHVHDEVACLRRCPELEGDLRVRPDGVVVRCPAAHGHRGRSLRRAKTVAIHRHERALAVLASGIGTARQVGEEEAHARDRRGPDGASVNRTSLDRVIRPTCVRDVASVGRRSRPGIVVRGGLRPGAAGVGRRGRRRWIAATRE